MRSVTRNFAVSAGGQLGDFDVALARKELEELARPMTDSALKLCEQVLEQKTLFPGDVDEVLLVGEQCRMPLFRLQLVVCATADRNDGIHDTIANNIRYGRLDASPFHDPLGIAVQAFGAPAAFLSGWTSFVAGFSGAIAASAAVLVFYLGRFAPGLAHQASRARRAFRERSRTSVRIRARHCRRGPSAHSRAAHRSRPGIFVLQRARCARCAG